MKKRSLIFIGIVLIGLALITSPFWYSGKKTAEKESLDAGIHKGEVLEVTQTTKYTYLLLEEDHSEYWIAIARQDIRPGTILYFTNPLEMKDFSSKELGKTFDRVYFVQQISDNPDFTANPPGNTATANATPPRKQPETRKPSVRVEKLPGGVSIAELYEFHPRYAGKSIKIRGEVTRFSTGIMGKNWVHIQDGTEFAGNFDLVITTLDSTSPGSTCTFTGAVKLNQDLGAGYFFKILLDNAKITGK